MTAEILTEELLRTSLTRLSREVAKTHPQFSELLTQHTMRTCSLVPDPERARHFQELGVLLIDLGRLYLSESEMLLGATGSPESESLE
ncbi:hypothetical protein [Lentzea sp. NEAU-D7]|uniref:hypothetical protein n=1 Tax=Lentzea sp. NEAU-D7 TaxID=2994667 RepID=UPI00224B6F70|nr:hypothetical protein [Lentzea sp. NEAU-D7]MCX2953570.1 hypothetical protein [Lentzea sp. NEAU-D7]